MKGIKKNENRTAGGKNMLLLLLRLVLSTLHFFAKIKVMNLEDLGSQFISNFHQSQNQIQPLYNIHICKGLNQFLKSTFYNSC